MGAGQAKRFRVRLLGLVGVALAQLCWMPYGLAEALPDRHKQLFDHAGLLSIPAAGRIADRLAEARSEGRDLVIVTVESLEDEPAERYARRLVRRLGVGSDAKTGALLLIAERQRRIWIEPVPSAAADGQPVSFRSIGQGVIARAFGTGHYDAGVERGVEALLELLWPRAAAAATLQPEATTAVEAAMAQLVPGERSWTEELGDLLGVGLLAFLAAVAGPLPAPSGGGSGDLGGAPYPARPSARNRR